MSKDHCTLFPEGDWAWCCKQHDDDYSAGSGIGRKVADKRLRYCVEQGGKPKTAAVMYWGTRLFGWLFYRK